MKIAMAASPLPGLHARRVADTVRRAWSTQRPDDAIDVRPVSDAVAMPYVSSGIEELLGMSNQVELLDAPTRRFAWAGRGRILFDYTHVLTGLGRVRTDMLGQDLAWAMAHDPSEVVIALPIPPAVGDLGLGMIGELAGRPLPASWRLGDPVPADLAEQIASARALLSGGRVTVFVAGEQRLLGFSGLARACMRAGMDPSASQRTEKDVADVAARVTAALDALPDRDLLETNRGGKGPYLGAGAGAAFGLQAVGARLFSVREAVFAVLNGWAEGADLCLYVCGSIGERLPGGLHAAVDHAREQGVPIFVVHDSGGLRRGELARLGLNGAYQIRPERTEADEPETPQSAARVSERLEALAVRLARTWGWD